MANFKILSELCVIVPNEHQVVVYVDGEDNLSIEQFYITLAKQLQFPSDFGTNLDAFDEMLNDLSWLAQNEIFIVFRYMMPRWLAMDCCLIICKICRWLNCLQVNKRGQINFGYK
mgnify:CR=1 FL=1